MKEIKYCIKKYYNTIIIVLLIIILFKSCKSCSSERRFEYNINKYNCIIDSLNTLNEGYISDIKYLNDTVNNLRRENNILKDIISETKKDKEFYRNQNKNLANMAIILTKKDTIK
jgi:predicted RNase H-like nuclease (RuvC/YqgF family)